MREALLCFFRRIGEFYYFVFLKIRSITVLGNDCYHEWFHFFYIYELCLAEKKEQSFGVQNVFCSQVSLASFE